MTSLSSGRRYLSGSSCSYGFDGRLTNAPSSAPTLQTAWYTPHGMLRSARSWPPRWKTLMRPYVGESVRAS
jgi:hypothetical protein